MRWIRLIHALDNLLIFHIGDLRLVRFAGIIGYGFTLLDDFFKFHILTFAA